MPKSPADTLTMVCFSTDVDDLGANDKVGAGVFDDLSVPKPLRCCKKFCLDGVSGKIFDGVNGLLNKTTSSDVELARS